jgi:hypothetical protein
MRGAGQQRLLLWPIFVFFAAAFAAATAQNTTFVDVAIPYTYVSIRASPPIRALLTVWRDVSFCANKKLFVRVLHQLLMHFNRVATLTCIQTLIYLIKPLEN